MPLPRILTTLALTALVTLTAPAIAGALGPRTLSLVTPGTQLRPVTFWLASEDGTRVFFRTDEQLTPADRNASFDVYERHNGVTGLISSGTPGAAATLEAISADGTRAFFSTTASLDPADTDATLDVYERRADGTLRLVTPGVEPVDDVAVNADGSRVVFGTTERLLPEDTDNEADVYERHEDGGLRLISPGSADEFAGFQGASRDFSRIRFTTREQLLPEDTDAGTDIYERHVSGALRMISTGGTDDDVYDAVSSQDATRVYFETHEAIPGTGDFDTVGDVYERRLDGSLRLVTDGNSGTFASETIKHVSADGSRVTFDAINSLVPADTNPYRDTYQRLDDGSLRLISTGTGDRPATFAGASDDGTVVYFTTEAAIPGTGDTETADDVYRRGADGALNLISGGIQNIPAVPIRTTADGSRFFFHTDEGIDATDNDGLRDVYEGTPGAAPRLISTGTELGAQPAQFEGAARDGSRVFFSTTEAITGLGDNDLLRDVYERRWNAPSFASAPVVAGTPQLGATLTCAFDVVAEQAVTTVAWERDGAVIAGATGPSYVPSASDIGAAVACRVRAVNAIGAAEQASPPVGVAVPVDPPSGPVPPAADPIPPFVPAGPVADVVPLPAADTRRPRISLTTATCPARIRRSTAQCRRYRSTLAAWRTLRGKVTDAAPSSGLSRVTVGVVRRTDKRCAAFTGGRFSSMSCTAAAKRTRTVKVTRGRFSLNLHGLAPGRHTIRIVATDRAGNRATLTRTVTIRRR